MLQAFAKNFLRGLLVVLPVTATVWVVWFVFRTLDGWINVEALLARRVPGAGLALTVAVITLTGFLAGNIFTRWLFHYVDRLLGRVPLVRLLYNALKDLIGAFVGDERRFDKPVLVRLGTGLDAAAIGFLTREDLGELGLPGQVAVYLPQSYNFAGNLIVVPSERVQPLDVPAPAMMTFILSGGVSGDGVARSSP